MCFTKRAIPLQRKQLWRPECKVCPALKLPHKLFVAGEKTLLAKRQHLVDLVEVIVVPLLGKKPHRTQ